MNNINRHKVFISYYHADDQEYKDKLVNAKYYDCDNHEYRNIFDDWSVADGDIDDSKLTDEQIREIIRDEYTRQPNVLILLCGKNTKNRKHIDWEIHNAMFDSEKNPKMGIIVINLPTINQNVRVSSEEEKEIVAPNSNWVRLSTREEYEIEYPYLPKRILDNLVYGAEITIVDWNTIYDGNYNKLMTLIDNAFKRRKTVKYDHSEPLRKRNSVTI